jgi:hypothetical protein
VLDEELAREVVDGDRSSSARPQDQHRLVVLRREAASAAASSLKCRNSRTRRGMPRGAVVARLQLVAALAFFRSKGFP